MTGNQHNHPNNNTILGLAIVGCGQIVTHHLTAIAKLVSTGSSSKKIHIRALVDPDPNRRKIIQELPAVQNVLNKDYGNSANNNTLRHYSNVKDMFKDVMYMQFIDIIFIAVPHDLHESIACEALTTCTNKLIVLEKPLAHTYDACQNLVHQSSINSTNNSSNMLYIAEQSPHWEEVIKAQQLIQEGAIGTIITCASYYYESMRNNITSGSVDSGGGLGWRGLLERAGGGITIDGGLHWIRPITEMLMSTKITKVTGIVQNNIQPELQMEGESLAHAIFELSKDTSSTSTASSDYIPQQLYVTFSANMLSTAPMAHDECPYFRITGTKGEIIIYGTGLLVERSENDGHIGGLKLYNEQYPIGIDLFPKNRRGGFFLGFQGLWKEIIRVYNEHDVKSAHNSVLKAFYDVQTVLALYQSSKSKQWEHTTIGTNKGSSSTTTTVQTTTTTTTTTSP